MSNNNITDTVDEIIDLTDVVSVGNAAENKTAPNAEDDVLDSLVSDFEKNLNAVPASDLEEEKEESDEPLDLAKLDNLISSYNIDFDAEDENNQEGENQEPHEIDMQKGMEVAYVQDDAPQHAQANIDENNSEQNIQENSSINTDDIPSFEDIDLPSLAEEHEDEIDKLTKDIIDGTNNSEINPKQNIQKNPSVQKENEDNSFSALLNEEVAQQDAKVPQAQAAQGNEAPLDMPLQDMPLQSQNQRSAAHAAYKNQQQAPVTHKPAANIPAPEMPASETPVVEAPQAPLEEETLKSDMAEDVEEINEDVFNNIFNELSLEHETDEEVVPFAQDASFESMPIHLKGDVSFIEAQENGKSSDDVHLVQSASKVLASGEAYLEKFNGEDDSVGAKIKNISTKVVSLEQRLMGSDSKSQDNALELTYRINGLETKLTELQDAVKAELITIKTDSAKIDALSDENQLKENMHDLAVLIDKIQALETRIATLDDIFSEQKMLNDELSRNLDNLIQNASDSSQVKALEEKIVTLEGKLSEADAKLAALEENIEKAASLAAAKVLREEIIPLLGQQ